eukprot:scaffold142564_cov23-Tisochrysis_lutea.AAC.2
MHDHDHDCWAWVLTRVCRKPGALHGAGAQGGLQSSMLRLMIVTHLMDEGAHVAGMLKCMHKNPGALVVLRLIKPVLGSLAM